MDKATIQPVSALQAKCTCGWVSSVYVFGDVNILNLVQDLCDDHNRLAHNN